MEEREEETQEAELTTPKKYLNSETILMLKMRNQRGHMKKRGSYVYSLTPDQ